MENNIYIINYNNNFLTILSLIKTSYFHRFCIGGFKYITLTHNWRIVTIPKS